MAMPMLCFQPWRRGGSQRISPSCRSYCARRSPEAVSSSRIGRAPRAIFSASQILWSMFTWKPLAPGVSVSRSASRLSMSSLHRLIVLYSLPPCRLRTSPKRPALWLCHAAAARRSDYLRIGCTASSGFSGYARSLSRHVKSSTGVVAVTTRSPDAGNVEIGALPNNAMLSNAALMTRLTSDVKIWSLSLYQP
jgi:hypothetical protein